MIEYNHQVFLSQVVFDPRILDVVACWCLVGGTQTMEMEYGRPVEEIFVDITPEPLAAASLGQVPTSFSCSRPPFLLALMYEPEMEVPGGGR